MPPAPILKLTNVAKRYDSLAGAEPLAVLQGISLEMARGESLGIIGPSGSGKSTLLNIIGTLDQPTSGQVTLDGQDLGRLGELELATLRNRQIGFIFQAHHLLPQCTVLENVLVPTLAKVGQASRLPQESVSASSPSAAPTGAGETLALLETAEVRATRLLKRVGLDGRLHHRAGQLSGGERQRIAVVRALINQPQLLLADEPTGALDRASAQHLGQLLLELNREEGVTLIVVTHALELAHKMGRVFELQDGKLA